MAKINPILGDLRGSIAGNTFSKNTYGAYVRQKVSPVQPNTPYQLSRREQITTLSKRWSYTLTDAMRMAWNEFARMNPRTDPFGNPIYLNGIAMFIALNSNRIRAGDDVLDLPPLDLNVIDFESVEFTITTAKCELAYSLGTAIPPDYHQRIIIWASYDVDPGVYFYKPFLREILISDLDPGSPIDFTDAFKARWGNPRKDAIHWFFAKCYNQRNGAMSRGLAQRKVVVEAGP